MEVLIGLATRRAVRALRRATPAWITMLIVASSASLSPRAEALTSKEYQVKAVFLFNFAQFVDWPPEAFPESTTPLVIGVLGDDPFGAVLDEVVANETIRRRPVVVRRFQDVQEISICHILYIGASETPRLTRILAALEGRPVLTVGESKSFAKSNGVIQFILVENKIRLRINVTTARMARLSISSQLLRQAELVEAK